MKRDELHNSIYGIFRRQNSQDCVIYNVEDDFNFITVFSDCKKLQHNEAK